jgi:hypothetical protein
MGKIKIVLLVIILIVVALIVVALLVKPIQTNNSSELKNVDIAKEIYGFSAIIKKISGDTLTLESSIPLSDLTQEPFKTTLRAFVDDGTKIIKLKFPVKAEGEIIPEETEIKLKDLKVGDNVTVTSATNAYDELKNGKKFLLINIFIVEK